MPSSGRAPVWVPIVLCGCAVWPAGNLLAAEPAAGTQREAIGTVLGKTVYRDEIRADFPLRDELHRLFSAPVLERYTAEHKAAVTPTQAEIDKTAEYFDQRHREQIKD